MSALSLSTLHKCLKNNVVFQGMPMFPDLPTLQSKTDSIQNPLEHLFALNAAMALHRQQTGQQ